MFVSINWLIYVTYLFLCILSTVNQLIIEKPYQIENEYFSIVNMVGQELMKQPFTGLTTEIDISSLKSGLYFLSLKQDGKREVKKFVKL